MEEGGRNHKGEGIRNIGIRKGIEIKKEKSKG